MELDLTGLQVRTAGVGAADFSLSAAQAEPDAHVGREFIVGSRNTLRASIVDSHGSGMRANRYVTHAGPVNPGNLGEENRIEFSGDVAEFLRLNGAIEPIPCAEYFLGEHAALTRLVPPTRR